LIKDYWSVALESSGKSSSLSPKVSPTVSTISVQTTHFRRK